MAQKKVDTDFHFGSVGKIIGALLNPVTDDPGSPGVGELWFNTTADRLKMNTGAGIVSLALLTDVTGGAITGTLWNAQSVIVAVADDTPVPQTFAASTVLGRRATGDITAITYANLLADLEALGITADTFTGTIASTSISDFNTAVDARAQTIADALVDAAPGTLNTLNELAAALGDDPNFATTLTNSIATKTTKFAANIGNGSAQSFVVNHALATTDVVVSVRLNSGGDVVDCEIEHTDANNVTVKTNSVPTSNEYRVVVIG